VTKLLEKLGYGKDYKYPHDYSQGFVIQNYLPEGIKREFYHPTEQGLEKTLKGRLFNLWKKS
ncbi:MAG: replication-associated recombination protein A, partial [Caldimicrobium sp.]